MPGPWIHTDKVIDPHCHLADLVIGENRDTLREVSLVIFNLSTVLEGYITSMKERETEFAGAMDTYCRNIMEGSSVTWVIVSNAER